MFPVHLFTDHDFDVLACGVRRLLQEAGMKVHDEELLRRMRERGAEVDEKTKTARFTEEIIDGFVARQKAVPDEGAATPLPEQRTPLQPYRAGLPHLIAPRTYDFPARRRRPATRADLLEAIRLGDALEEVVTVSTPVVMSDVDPRIEAIEGLAMVVCNTNKPPSARSILPQHNPYFAEIEEIALGPSDDASRFVGTGGFLITPLTVGDRTAAMMLEGEKYKVESASVGTMAISGLSAPASIAGTVTMAAAELLGGMIVCTAANPHAKFMRCSTATGILDMRTGRACFGTPEASLQDAGVVQLFEARFGGQARISGMGYVDGRSPGLQVAYEKLMKNHALRTVLSGPLRVSNLGLVDAGSTFSPTQFVLELELDRGLCQGYKPAEVSEETMGLADMLRLGCGEGKTFLDTEHTLRYFRGFWHPTILDREAGPTGDAPDEEALLERADRYWREKVAEHRPAEVDPSKVQAVGNVLQRARAHLLQL